MPTTKELIPLLTSFQGRINRQTYWIYTIILVVIDLVVNAVVSNLGTGNIVTLALSAVGGLILIALIWPLLAIQVKRWHDRNKSGWWCLIGLVPCIGSLWVLVECGCLPAVNEGNRFGS